MKTLIRHTLLIGLLFYLTIITAPPVLAAESVPNPIGVPEWVNNWIGYDTSAMTDTEFESMVCIAAAVTMGTLITVVGGTAIVIGGSVGRATGTAIALPVLISSMWSSCAFSRAVLPAALWLKNRSTMLVKKLGDDAASNTNNGGNNQLYEKNDIR